MSLAPRAARLAPMVSAPSTGSSVRGWPADRWPGTPPDDGDERALVGALRHRDERAFAAVVRRHHAAMVRVARLYVADRAVAEEVVQDTWATVFSGIDRFEERSSLKTWIYRILVNRARTRGEREHRTIPF